MLPFVIEFLYKAILVTIYCFSLAQPGDQLLEVNDVKFLNIIHSDAANALRAQRCMVMKVKDVGKIPHSRITTYGQTEWKSPTIK